MRSMTPANRRYLQRVAISMAIYLISLFGANYLIENELVASPLIWLPALLPGLAVVGVIYAVARLIVELDDEFLRMLLVRQNLIATGFALSIATVWGFFEDFDLVAHLETYWVFVLWCVGLAVGAVANRVTHGTWGEC